MNTADAEQRRGHPALLPCQRLLPGGHTGSGACKHGEQRRGSTMDPEDLRVWGHQPKGGERAGGKEK